MALDEKDVLTGDAALAKVRDLLARLPIAFMITVVDGEVHARPIGVVGDHAAFDGSLWFITDRRSRKVAEIERGATTALVFQDDQRGTYLSLSGQARVVEDRPRLESLYTSVQRTWFPDGPGDPNILLISFDADSADYWEGHQSKTRLVAAFVKSIVTGQPGSSGDAGVAKLGGAE
jgi:general stress protein 26